MNIKTKLTYGIGLLFVLITLLVTVSGKEYDDYKTAIKSIHPIK